jgi:CelD/BcsL family acetyltransferase involved in cellulose biosynthesis
MVPGPIAARAIDGAEATFEVLCGRDEVAVAAPAWEALLPRSSCNRALGGPTWFAAWLDAFDEYAPYVVVARRAGEVVGVFPLVITPEGDAVLSPCNWTDYNDAVVAGDDRRVAAGMLAWALPGATPYRRLILRRVRHDSCLAGAVARLRGGDAFSGPASLTQASRYIDLSGGYERYLAGRSKTFRRSLAKARRRAEGAGLVVRELSPRHDPAEDLAAAFLAVHLPRFGKKSCFYPDRTRHFLKWVLPALFVAGHVRAFGVFAGPRPAALDLCLLASNGLALWNGGFTADIAEFSPGTLLLDHEAWQAASDGLAELDLLRGEQEWKGRWATGRRLLGQVVFEGESVCGAAGVRYD